VSGWTRAQLILAATESTELRIFLLKGLHQTVSVYLLVPDLVLIQFLLADCLQAKLILATSLVVSNHQSRVFCSKLCVRL